VCEAETEVSGRCSALPCRAATIGPGDEIHLTPSLVRDRNTTIGTAADTTAAADTTTESGGISA
jgi:hypothetical protein